MSVNIFYRLLFLILIFLQITSTEDKFRLYYSDRVSNGELYHDCLLHYGPKKLLSYQEMKNKNQIIAFCIRPFVLHSNIFINNENQVIYGTPIDFKTLKSKNVTSQQLYLSFAPIDVVERYEEFLESSNQSLSNQLFHNCSMLWFGEFCQYTFRSTLSFDDIVYLYIQNSIYPFNNGTCYIFMKCNRSLPPLCLDWREICDGKIDCLDDGIDELFCEELDLNECTIDEFRCNNGFCIPEEFFNDDPYDPDCIDRSDERSVDGTLQSYTTFCHSDVSFRCEEVVCPNERMISCGDGYCVLSGTNCKNRRNVMLEQAKLSWNANLHLSFDCWISLVCLTIWPANRRDFFDWVNCPMNNISERLIRDKCPTVFFFPAHPIVLDHIRFAYETNLTNTYDEKGMETILLPHYVCYDQQLCDWLPSTRWVNNSTCRSWSELKLEEVSKTAPKQLGLRVLGLFQKCSTKKKSSIQCPKSKPFQCSNSSKCLALHQLYDGHKDCFEGEDEVSKDSCSLPDKHYRLKCEQENKCMTVRNIGLGESKCQLRTNAGYRPKMSYILTFQTLCNGFVEHDNINDLNYTDEMDCEYWPCSNAYTRCDGQWNCQNGADETECSFNPCAPDRHPCILPYSYNLTCLPLSKIDDGHLDCLGGYDERNRCSHQLDVYRCFNETTCLPLAAVCNSKEHIDCAVGDDEGEWCTKIYDTSQWRSNKTGSSLFSPPFNWTLYRNQRAMPYNIPNLMNFQLKNHHMYPINLYTSTKVDFIATQSTKIIRSRRSNSNLNQEFLVDELRGFCHRGVPIYSSDSRGKYCLCSPSYFGDQCEYQSERVSLILQFRTAEWPTLLTYVIMLLDNDTNINSYERIDHLSVHDCGKKFTFTLLYSTRPKYVNHSYYIRLDLFDKVKMEYHSSMFYPVRFSFLPVHRFSFQITIPVRESLPLSKNCSLKCLHGQCTYFVNTNKFFCRCFDGYSGTLCTINNQCHCSSDSICIGTIYNRSICICPLNKFGPRCYLKNPVCMSNPCYNGGQCVSNNEKFDESEYFCVCPKGFIGSNCEKAETKIEFHFSKHLIIPQTILVHFFNASTKYKASTELPPVDPTQTTMFAKIRFDQISTIVNYSGGFDLIFVEFNKDYYLTLLQHNYALVNNISTTIIPEHRCLPISVLFDKEIQNFSTWHRAKYYHIPCQNRSDFVCFYDNEQFMCLCDIDRHANCFKFNYNFLYNCFGYNYCQNGGRCYQNNNTCPTTSACSCNECYFGNLCQFTTIGFGLSLDVILGYSIRPNISFYDNQ